MRVVNSFVTIMVVSTMMLLAFVVSTVPGATAAASATVSTNKTLYLSGEIPLTYETWSSVYFKDTDYGPNVWVYRDGVLWHTHTTLGTGSHSSNWGSAPAVGTHTLKLVYAIGWNRYLLGYTTASVSTTFTVSSYYTISGYTYGTTDGGVSKYTLAGATVTAKQETPDGLYTGIIYSATSGTNGYYTMKVAASWVYHMIVSGSDHVTSSYLHLGVYSSKTQDFTLKCQWKEYAQRWESATIPKDINQPRLFERDVNGDGIVDSVCIFLDAWYLTQGPLDPDPVSARPAQATFMIELQGYRYSGTYFASDEDTDFYPKVYPSNGYYTSKKMVLWMETDLALGEVVGFPSSTNPVYTVTVTGVHFESTWPSTIFCFNSGTYNTALDPFNTWLYAYYYGTQSWPVGDGTDLATQMTTLGYPNTRAYFSTTESSLSTFPTTSDTVINFYGNFELGVVGVCSANQLESEDMYWDTLNLCEFGFYLDY